MYSRMSIPELLVSNAIGGLAVGLTVGMSRVAMSGGQSTGMPVGIINPNYLQEQEARYQRAMANAQTEFEGCKKRVAILGSVIEQHTSYVNATINSDYKSTETLVDNFIKSIESEHDKDLLFKTLDTNEYAKNGCRHGALVSIFYSEKTLKLMSKKHNLYSTIFNNKNLDTKQKIHLATKLHSAGYGYLEYLAEAFETISFAQIMLFMQKLPTTGQPFFDFIKDTEQSPHEDSNLFLSILKNPNLSSQQKLEILNKMLKLYDGTPHLLLLFSKNILDHLIGNKNFEDFIFLVYTSARLTPFTHAAPHGVLYIDNEKELFERLLAGPRFKDKTIELLFDVYIKYFCRNTDIEISRMFIEKFYLTYFNKLNSVREIQDEYEQLQARITKLDSIYSKMKYIKQDLLHPLLDNVKESADKRILDLTSEEKADDKPHNIREFLGKTPSPSCWACLWSTPSQKLYDALLAKKSMKEAKPMELKK